MTRLLIACAVAIAIGSTYPFDFQPRVLDTAALLRFVDACCRPPATGDVLSNVAAFAILGCLGLASARDNTSLLRRTLLVLLAGTAFSLALQLAQFYLPSRPDSLETVGGNFIGLLAGAVLGCLLQKPQKKPGQEHEPSTDATQVYIRSSSGMVAVTVNLQETQVEFLEQVAAKLGIDISQLCCKLIDQMLAELAAWEADESEGGAAATTPQKDDSLTPTARGNTGSWTRRTFMLEPQQVRAVRELAQGNGSTLSRTIRHIIAAFMESAADGTKGADELLTQRVRRLLPARGTPARHSPARRRRTRRRSRQGRRVPFRQWAATIVLAALAALGFFLSSHDAPVAQGPTIVSAAPWSSQNIEILFDHHTHTKHSDGALSVTEVVDLALSAGCGALAITDHSDGETAVGPLELETFRELRRQLSGLLIFGGVEINMPSYGGREHATLIVDPENEEFILPVMRDIAEDGVKQARSGTDKNSADDELLQTAAQSINRGGKLLMIYNHPSREDRDKTENYEDILRWNAQAPIFIGFAGAPGHQNAPNIGSYHKNLLPIDRWDPVVAEVGGTWDRLLSEGHQLWGAIAGSDFHNKRLDRIPCEFARTHVLASGFGYDEVLDALRAGTFWADHGKILDRLSFSAEVTGLASPAFPGSVVNLGNEHPVIQARVDIVRGPGSQGSPLQVEFIGNCYTGEAQILATEKLDAEATTATAMIASAATGADGHSCFLRTRVRLDKFGEPDLMAYTNPIRFLLN